MKKLLYDIILSNEFIYNSKTFSRYQYLIDNDYGKSSLNRTCPELNLVREIVCRKRRRSWISGPLDAPGLSVSLNLTSHGIYAIAHTPTTSSSGQPLKLAEYESVRRELERQEDAEASVAALLRSSKQHRKWSACAESSGSETTHPYRQTHRHTQSPHQPAPPIAALRHRMPLPEVTFELAARCSHYAQPI